MKYSVVIPTYNHCEDLLKPCLESIKKFTDLSDDVLSPCDVEVIVVANGCKDNTREYVESLGAPFKMVWSDEPWGYTKSTNEGIKIATGDYVVLLNNDTVLLQQEKNAWLKMMEQPFEDPKVGITGPMQAYCPYAKKDFLIFFCVMIKKEMFQTIGLLDEIFNPGFGEDTDFCIKLQELGYKIVQVPDYKIHYSKPNFMVGGFPMYHKGEGTFADWKGGMELLSERRFMLMNRYAKNIKLNLGSGDRPMQGYFNIDIKNPKADLEWDVRKLPLENGKVDEITAYHLIEHFKIKEIESVFREWFRVLKPEGKLVLEFPDVKALFKRFEVADTNERKHILHCVFGAHTPEFPHLFGWYDDTIWETLHKIGFHNIEIKPTQVEHWGINMRIECTRGADLPEGFFSDFDIQTYKDFMRRVPIGGRIAELGCWKGRSLCSVADIIKERQIQVVAVDTFAGSASESECQASQEDAKNEDVHGEFIKNTTKYGLQPSVYVMETHKASSLFEDNYFDMVFVDADHSFESCQQDLQDWWPKVKRGGFFAGHDCMWPGVAKALTAEFGHLVLTNRMNVWWIDKHRVYDCFPFCNELDQLEIRLNELDGEVDYFVLAEGTETHAGQPKPLHFAENKERFAKWLPKIRHIVVDQWPEYIQGSSDSPWARERIQRNAIMEGIADARPCDVLILGDADEIISAAALKKYKRHQGLCSLGMSLHYYFLNYVSAATKWFESKIVPVQVFKELGLNPCSTRYVVSHMVNGKPSFTTSTLPKLENVGWHFSFQGGVDEVIKKISGFAHQEYNKPELLERSRVEKMIDEGLDVFGMGVKFTAVPIDSSFPRYIQDNEEAFNLKGMIRKEAVAV